MHYCIGCKKEMRCVKTGAALHFGGGHTYGADIFVCPECGQQVAKAASCPTELNEKQLATARERLGDGLIEMTRS